MPLHRDIHWLGRQWAVTGHGLQLINQKQMGYYDIEIARLGEPGVIEAMQSKAWIDRPDFDKAVEVARSRFAHTAAVGAPLPLVPAASPPPRVPPPRVPPPVRRAAVERPPASAPTLEELLAKLKVKSAVPATKPADVPRVAPPKAESRKPEAPKPEAPKPEAPKPDVPKPDVPKSEVPKSEVPKSEVPKFVGRKPELRKPELPKSELRQAAPPPPAAVADRASTKRIKPVLPVFDRKIAGSARFVRPWRARLTP